MNWKVITYISIFALIFLDQYFINIPIGPLRMTLLRMMILSLFFILSYRLFFKKEELSFSNIRFPLSFLGIWIYYGLLSIIWTSEKTTGIKELYYFFIFILFIIVLIYLLQKVTDSWIQLPFWLSGIFLILLCMIEFVFDRHLPTSRFVVEAARFTDLEANRATTFFYNENDLGLYLVLIFPFYLKGLLNRSVPFKLVNLLVLVAILAINYINDARLSVIASFIQIFFFIYILRKNWIKKGFQLLLLFSPLLLFVAVYFGIPKIIDLNPLQGFALESGSGFIRLNLYLNALYATFQSFMLGVGPGNFQHNIYPMFNTLGIINPHNWWFEVLTNYGFFIFVGYCCFFFFLLVKLLKSYRMDKEKNGLGLTLFLGFIGFIFSSLGPSTVFYFWPMWLMYGVSLAYISKFKL